ncbi:uncharacterized protein [Miscanthus floridulus]|uniref:uncharacterized protein isoform X3 n=1 Tax=Miscanthus floridulus TaxID=154761 RepID=UPI00345AE6BD
MAKSFQLEHYQLTNTLSIQLVWYSRRSLSYYTPRKPAPSLPLATNLVKQVLKKMMNLMRRFHRLFHYTLTQMMIKAKKVNVVWRSLLLPSPLKQRFAWRKQRILTSIKMMLVALTMMKVTKMLIQKVVNRVMMRLNSSDEDDGDSSNEEDDEDSPKSAKRKNRPAETPLKTPPGKKARITTPSMGKKTVSDDAKKSNHVHVGTPYPSSKQVKMTRSIIDSSNQSTGYACRSCSKTFYSSVGLETHCKVKHSTRK